MSGEDYPTKPCGSCGSMIIWATSEASGRPIPVDPDRTMTGNIELYVRDKKVIARILTMDQRRAKAEPTYWSHFVTCPEASEWRSSR